MTLPFFDRRDVYGPLKMIQVLSLLFIVQAAVLCDLDRGKIPNALILAGLGMGFIYQSVLNGAAGAVLFLGGIFLPVLVFGPLYYFRMIGAGDIKLMSVIGAFMGPADCLSCMLGAVLAGGVLAFGLVLYHHDLSVRLFCFADYVREYRRTGVWKPYLEQVDKRAKFCFSIPVLISVLGCIGGII